MCSRAQSSLNGRCAQWPGPNTSFRNALVVKSGAGEIVSEIKLESSGNLSVFFQQLKAPPLHRPHRRNRPRLETPHNLGLTHFFFGSSDRRGAVVMHSGKGFKREPTGYGKILQCGRDS